MLFVDGKVGFSDGIAAGVMVGDTWGTGVLNGVGFVGRIGVIGEGIFVFLISPKLLVPGSRYPGAGLEGTSNVVEEPGVRKFVYFVRHLVQIDNE